jgi:molybdopterin synthase catalytic subunit
MAFYISFFGMPLFWKSFLMMTRDSSGTHLKRGFAIGPSHSLHILDIAMIPRAHLQASPLNAELLREAAKSPKSGAVAVFEGCARDSSMGKAVVELCYEAFEPMALAQLEEMRQEAIQNFGLNDCLIHHRLGVVPPAEAAVAIVCASAHRDGTLRALAWLLEELKKRAPIWKQETYSDGSACWTEGDKIVESNP